MLPLGKGETEGDGHLTLSVERGALNDSQSPPNLPLLKGGTELLAKHTSTLLHSFTPSLLKLDEG